VIRALLVISAVAVLSVGAAWAGPPSTTSGATALPACTPTLPNGRMPSPLAGVNHGNGRLYVGLWDRGVVVVPATEVKSDGSIDAKFPWWRGVRGRLAITAVRVDEAAPPARAFVSRAYGLRGFQPTTVIFPTVGCWRVTGRVGLRTRLTFVTLVTTRPSP
jgi:hypothetical protein